MTTRNTAVDFVSTDAAALASHMRRCAYKKGRFFNLKVAMEQLHSLMFPRILTVGLVSLLLVAATSIV